MSRALLTGLALGLALVTAPSPVQAQSWIAVGPPGGNVRSLAADPRDPQRLYLGTAGGVLYRSDDGGQNWRRLVPGFPLPGRSLDEIVVDERGVIFIGYWEVNGKGGGVARSADGGESFRMLKDLDGQSVRALAIAPSDSRIMAAGTLDGVYLSRDGGRGWKRITPKGHADLRNFESVAFDPQDPQTLYVGTWHLGWKTSDGGATWNPAHKGMIDDSHVMTLTVDHRNPQTVYATACTGIYRSSEGGKEWTKLHGIPYSARRTRAFFQGNDGNLLIAGTTEGLWISQDGAGTWRQATHKDLVVNALVVQPDGTILLGAEEAGVLRSSDRGFTWTASNTGFSERFVSKMLFDTEGERMLVAVRGNRYGGVFASPNPRGPWVHLGEGLAGREVLALAVLGRTIYAGTDEGIYTRAPKDTIWTRVPMELKSGASYPRVTELIARRPSVLLAGTATGIIRSVDGGRTWTQPTLGKSSAVWGLAASHIDPDRVVAATPSGFYRSDDGGANWTLVSPAPNAVTTHALAFSPAEKGGLFATTSGGLYRSDDHGETWHAVSGGIPQSDLTGIAMHPDGRTIYASDFTWGGVFRSRNGGVAWKRMPIDGLASDRVWTVGLDPADPDQLLVGSSAGGLHMLATPSMATGTQGASATTNRRPAPSR